MDSKEVLEKTEEFAMKIIKLAAWDGLTVRELCKAADTAQGIAYNSIVDSESIEKTDFPSRHIVEPTEMLFTPTDSSGTKYSVESIGIPCPVIDREQCQ